MNLRSFVTSASITTIKCAAYKITLRNEVTWHDLSAKKIYIFSWMCFTVKFSSSCSRCPMECKISGNKGGHFFLVGSYSGYLGYSTGRVHNCVLGSFVCNGNRWRVGWKSVPTCVSHYGHSPLSHHTKSWDTTISFKIHATTAGIHTWIVG